LLVDGTDAFEPSFVLVTSVKECKLTVIIW
jgi:hypothetical protein